MATLVTPNDGLPPPGTKTEPPAPPAQVNWYVVGLWLLCLALLIIAVTFIALYAQCANETCEPCKEETGEY